MSYYALVPAAGTGARMGESTPKQYLPLAGGPMISHALTALCSHPKIEKVFVVLAADDAFWTSYNWLPFAGRLRILRCGGTTRAESVRNGLEAMAELVGDDDWVLVHDAARPCLTHAHIDALIDGVDPEVDIGGILAEPVSDTVKRGIGGAIVETLPREGMWRAQTPQMFRHETLTEALVAPGPDITDEASAVEVLGLQPRLIESDGSNLKVTYPFDLQVAEWILQTRKAQA
ncbi:MAG TPA: 2-C-methyl-D-erythritol 4-phosphate cytidylyltransferase [Rhodocyclaceae bacterium]|nr:2-C-methyl-D-erythritol 4-phosphate cytidylyltransferase [Rhodocyclaceae bacterium]